VKLPATHGPIFRCRRRCGDYAFVGAIYHARIAVRDVILGKNLRKLGARRLLL
jgi:hypothetical protein